MVYDQDTKLQDYTMYKWWTRRMDGLTPSSLTKNLPLDIQKSFLLWWISLDNVVFILFYRLPLKTSVALDRYHTRTERGNLSRIFAKCLQAANREHLGDSPSLCVSPVHEDCEKIMQNSEVTHLFPDIK